MRMINEYAFLSNFYETPITMWLDKMEITFQNSEAAFQAHKNYERAEDFAELSPAEAKKLGRKVELTTPNWETNRLYAMARVLHHKFQNAELMDKLKQVQGEIVEDNTWNDYFWGVCRGKGKNMLGKLLMNIRDNDNSLITLCNYVTEELIPLV